MGNNRRGGPTGIEGRVDARFDRRWLYVARSQKAWQDMMAVTGYLSKELRSGSIRYIGTLSTQVDRLIKGISFGGRWLVVEETGEVNGSDLSRRVKGWTTGHTCYPVTLWQRCDG